MEKLTVNALQIVRREYNFIISRYTFNFGLMMVRVDSGQVQRMFSFGFATAPITKHGCFNHVVVFG